MQRVVPCLLPAPAQGEAGLRGEGLQICVQPVRAHQAAKAGWPGVPAHIPQEGPRGDNVGAGAPVPGGEDHCRQKRARGFIVGGGAGLEGQGVHRGGWGRSGGPGRFIVGGGTGLEGQGVYCGGWDGSGGPGGSSWGVGPVWRARGFILLLPFYRKSR